MTSSEHRIDARDWSLLGVLSVLWGGSFFFAGVSLRELPPLTVVFLRVALAAIILLPVLWIYRIRFPARLSDWKPFFALALSITSCHCFADHRRASVSVLSALYHSSITSCGVRG
jgi:drug/metabolite transporter (DMT)-like permease